MERGRSGAEKKLIEQHVKRQSDWLIAGIVAVIVFVIVGVLYWLRFRVFNECPTPSGDYLYFVNKALASSGMILVVIGVLIGPVVKVFPKLVRWTEYRKEIGIVGFLMAAFHGFVSLFLLPGFFPGEWLVENWISILFAVLSVVVMTFILMFSNNQAIYRLGFKKWKAIQRLVYVALAMCLLHVSFLGRVEIWRRSFGEGASVIPPIAMMATILVLVAIVIRIVFIFVDAKKSRKKD